MNNTTIEYKILKQTAHQGGIKVKSNHEYLQKPLPVDPPFLEVEGIPYWGGVSHK